MSRAEMKFLIMLLIDSIYFSGIVTYGVFLQTINTLNYLQTFLVVLSVPIILILGSALYFLTGASIPGVEDGE